MAALVVGAWSGAGTLPADEPSLPRLPDLPVLAAPPAVPVNTGEPVLAEAVVAEKTPALPLAIAPDGSLPDRILQILEDSAELKPLLADSQLTGWEVLDGKREAWISNGNIISCVGVGGGWLCTQELYSDFICRFEYRLSAGANTGFGFRCLKTGNPSFTGFEVQLLDDSSSKYKDLRPEQYTGSLYYKQGPARPAPIRKLGEWNQAEIVCFGNLVRVKINGEVVNEVNLESVRPAVQQASAQAASGLSRVRPQCGPIAFQSFSTRVDFRNLELRDLAEKTGDGVRYVDLKLGEGPAANADSEVEIHYIGQLVDGTLFANSRDAESPVKVSLEDVIPGWQSGIAGMKVGGRRRLIIPAEQAYGAEGVEGLIPGDATLIFELDLLAVAE